MFPIASVRSQFPSLNREQNGKPVAYFDGPAGTQVPQSVVDAISESMLHHNANRAGMFSTSREIVQLMDQSHQTVAALLNAPDPNSVSFGPNMTTLTFAFSRVLAKTWSPGDEIIVSRLDHDANYTPWVLAARDAGVNVKFIDINPNDTTLNLDSLRSNLSSRTRLVAVTAASNAVGTLTPVPEISSLVHAVGAELFVDAVHYAPHRSIDVTQWGCDYLVCSAYKFFGPHIGILWGKSERMSSLTPYKLRTSPQSIPGCWMTGTQNHACIVGVKAAIEYMASLSSIPVQTSNLRLRLLDAFSSITKYENELIWRLIDGLKTISGVTVYGISDSSRASERAPTVAFRVDGFPSIKGAEFLGDRGIFVWHGNYYALPLTERLGLEPEGIIRIGCMHYNTESEVDRTIETIREMARTGLA